MFNRRFFIILNIILLGFASFFLWKFIKIKKRPNVILITIDTLRPDHMGIYGYKKNTTPNIDHFFKDGYVFTNTYTSTPKTYASIASIMTGLSPSTTKIFDYHGRPLTNKEITLADNLHTQGYQTGAFVTNGALYYSPKSSHTNLQRGFDQFTFVSELGPESKAGFYDYSKLENLIEQGAEFMEENKNKPFFAWFHLINPHAPYEPYNNPKDKYKIESSRNMFRGLPSGCSNPNEPPVELISELTDLYDKEIWDTDNLVGKILTRLKSLNLDKKTIVVLTADHAEGFDHNYYFHHGSLYDSNLKIPLLIKNTKQKGKIIKTLTLNTSIKSQILELLNNNEPKYQAEKVVYGYNHFLRYFSIQKKSYKLILSLKGDCLYSGSKIELYNLQKDPHEDTNLAGKDYPEENELKNLLIKHLIKEKIPINGKLSEALN